MKITFDPNKNRLNMARHGVSFEDFGGFDAEPAIVEDRRFDYGELRFRAFGRIDGNGYCVVYTELSDGIRPISLRRAHEKEMRRYENP